MSCCLEKGMVPMRNYLDLVTVGYPTHWLLYLLCVLAVYSC